MSAQSIKHTPGPLLPMPPITEAALRVAVRRLDLAEAVTYEKEFHDAWQEAVQTDSVLPMRTFLHRWAVWVALHRHPDRSARLRELERDFEAADTVEEARKVGREIAEMLEMAASEVNG